MRHRIIGLVGMTAALCGYGHDVMTGGPGRDSLSDVFKPNESPVRQWDRYLGGSGKDRILIGGGVDVVFGGPGNDRILIFDDGDVDKVNCGQGYDTVKAQNVQNDDLKSCEKVVIYSAD